jgi:predicted solute-binding protein
LQQRNFIAAQAQEFGGELAYRYLTENIRFVLGDSEIAGLQRFAMELERLRLLPEGRATIEFV